MIFFSTSLCIVPTVLGVVYVHRPNVTGTLKGGGIKGEGGIKGRALKGRGGGALKGGDIILY